MSQKLINRNDFLAALAQNPSKYFGGRQIVRVTADGVYVLSDNDDEPTNAPPKGVDIFVVAATSDGKKTLGATGVLPIENFARDILRTVEPPPNQDFKAWRTGADIGETMVITTIGYDDLDRTTKINLADCRSPREAFDDDYELYVRAWDKAGMPKKFTLDEGEELEAA